MSDAPFNSAIEHGGWVAAFLIAIWGVVLRVILGRHYATLDEIRHLQLDMNTRLANVEGQLLQMRKPLKHHE